MPPFKRRLFILPAIIATIVAVICIIEVIMGTKVLAIEKLERIVSTLEVVLLIAGLITTVVGFYVWFYKSQLTASQKKEIEGLKLEQYNTLQSNLKLQIQLENLRQSTSDRVIPPAYFNTVKSKLAKHAGSDITIFCETNDAECTVFGEQIDSLFRAAKWKTEKAEGWFEPRIEHLCVYYKNKGDAQKAAYIAKLFKQMGFIITTQHQPKMNESFEFGIPRKPHKN